MCCSHTCLILFNAGEELHKNNCAPSFVRSLCENRRWLFPNNNHRRIHKIKDRKIDGAKLLLSLTTATLTILCVLCVFFDKSMKKTAFFYQFCTHPCKRISISLDVTIIAWRYKCGNTGCIARDCLCVYAYVRMALAIMPTSHAEVIIRSHCYVIMTAQFFAQNW